MCAECADLEPDEVDELIATVRSAPGTRADKLRLFIGQFDDPRNAEYCEPCAKAVLDTADGMNRL